ncbi:hypothetical protein H4S08_001671 [Coemansia sp. RSA 1365]|nr:hypothetical protein H4S08_001671 [Coemansia sp. RSA 1365]
MNATTHCDMTVYKFTGLGQEAAANVLPAVFDHIMNPLIEDDNFATEVYHVDQDGRQKGVVLSEMSDFAFKESSVRSHWLRQMLYPSSSTYAWESGGLPECIETLTTAEVLEYHRKFYNYNNLTLILVGSYDKQPAAIFDALDALDGEIALAPPVVKSPMPPPPQRWKEKPRENHTFASEKVDTGTMAFAWEGPPAEDVETRIAFEMIVDYLGNDTASPLRKRFTNRPVPIAGNIEFEIVPFFPAFIELSFTEVPFEGYISHAAAAAVATSYCRGTNGLDSYPSPTDAFGPVDLTKLHDDVTNLLAPNYYRRQVISTLTHIVDRWLSDNWSEVRRYMDMRTDFLASAFPQNAMNERSNGGLVMMLARDAVAYHLSPASTCLPQPEFASRGRLFSVRRELAQRGYSFWQSLIQKWLLDRPMVHLALHPDAKIGITTEAERILIQEYRSESMSPEEQATAQRRAKAASAMPRSMIPQEVLEALPPVPDIAKVQLPKYSGHSFDLSNSEIARVPFAIGRVLAAPGASEAKFQISLPLAGLASDLRPYLPLFVKLLRAQAGLIVPCAISGKIRETTCLPVVEPAGMPLAYLNSDQVNRACGSVLNKYDACIGAYICHDFPGNWPDEALTLYGSMKSEDLNHSFALLVIKLLFGDFGVDTLHNTAAEQEKVQLRARAAGSPPLIDALAWLRMPGPLDARAIESSVYNSDELAGHTVQESLGRAVNHFFQLPFLSAVTKSLDVALNGDGLAPAQGCRVVDAVERIRAHLVDSVISNGLVHISFPTKVSTVEARKALEGVVEIWSFYASAWLENLPHTPAPSSPYDTSVYYKAENSPPIRRHKKQRTETENAGNLASTQTLGAPYGSKDYVPLKSSVGIHMTLATLQTSYVGVQIPLTMKYGPEVGSKVPFEKQLQKLPDREVYALQLLTTMLNRTGGLIKNSIRGRGYAYGVGVHPRLDEGYFAVYISHAVDPIKSLQALWETIRFLQSETLWNETINEFELNAACSMYMLRRYTDLSDMLELDDARSLFLGYSGLEQRMLWITKHVEAICLEDIRHVFLKYLIPLISKEMTSALYLVVTPQYTGEPESEFLKRLNENAYGIDFKSVSISALDPIVHV